LLVASQVNIVVFVLLVVIVCLASVSLWFYILIMMTVRQPPRAKKSHISVTFIRLLFQRRVCGHAMSDILNV